MNGLEREVCDALDVASQDRGLQPEYIQRAASLLQRGAKLQRDIKRFASAANDSHRGFVLDQELSAEQRFAADVRQEIKGELSMGEAAILGVGEAA
jgi:hypothetical protein